MPNRKQQIAGQIAESLVVAELGKRGFLATRFAGNIPDIDILAYRDTKMFSVQVKSVRSGSVSLKANRFLDIDQRGKKQCIKGKRQGKKGCIWVVVFLNEEGGEDYYICKEKDIIESVHKEYSAFLKKNNCQRRRNPESYHHSLTREHLASFKDNWGLFEK